MSKRMGRPPLYDPEKPRHQRLLNLSDELWNALGNVAGEGKRTAYIEERLRAIPEIAEELRGKRK